MTMFSQRVAELYIRLLIVDVAAQLPGQPVDQQAQLREADFARLLGTASVLALSDDADERARAYEIVTRTIELHKSPSDALLAIAELVFERLGNFPARQLLRERHSLRAEIQGTQNILRLESTVREMNNQVEGVDSNPLLLTNFQRDLHEALVGNLSVSVSAPTSAGKSFVLTLDVVRRMRLGLRQGVAFVVPTRALIRQIAVKLLHDLSRAGLEDVAVRTIPIPASPEKSPRGAVYVLTQERLIALLQSDLPGLLLTAIYIDEAQNISDSARGIVLHSAIDLSLERFPELEICFAGPMLRNPDYFLNTFQRNGRSGVVQEEQSPVSQNLILVTPVHRKPDQVACELRVGKDRVDLGIRTYTLGAAAYKRRAEFARAVTRDDESTIVYANVPSDAENIAYELADCIEHEQSDPDVGDLIQFLSEHIHPDYGLIRVLKKGVAFHYGEMPAIVRARIEDLFEAEQLRFMCCTSTLLQGVNLPARHIVIEDPRRGRATPMDRASFVNLAGRAGRLLKEFHGNVWCLRPNKWAEKSYEGVALQPVRSAFEQALDHESLIQRAIDGMVAGDEQQYADAALGKVFAEYTSEGKAIAESRYRTAGNTAVLEEIDRLCAAIRVSLPVEVFRRNATIAPMRLQSLHDVLVQELDPRIFAPVYPWEAGAYGKMLLIFQLAESVLAGVSNDSYKYHVWLAWQWIQDEPLRVIIDNKIRRRRAGVDVDAAIRELMSDIESVIRFRYVKHVRAYVDVLSVVLRSKGFTQEADRVAPLYLFLECGASHPIVLNLLSVGLSRTTSLLLKRKVSFPADASPEDCLRILRRLDITRYGLPAVCEREVADLLKS